MLLVGLASCGAPRPREPPIAPNVAATVGVDGAWEELQRALPGRWRAELPGGRSVTVSYRMVSKGSALVETFVTASGTETLTVLHRDGAALMLTHYCAQGNQARLRATAASRDRVVFELVDATNVSRGQGVMQKLVFTLRADSFDQESVYLDDGELGRTVLHFSRAPKE